MPRGRKPNDGRGRLGGRKPGTPNKDNPIKVLLREHSASYFLKNIDAKDVDWADDEWKKKHKGEVFSKYELDLLCMKAADRAKCELDLLAFHTPKMQAVSADMSVQTNKTITDILLSIAAGDDPATDNQ